MSEIKKNYLEIKSLEAERLKLTLMEPKVILSGATFLLFLSAALKSMSMSVFSLGLAACGLNQIFDRGDLDERKKQNQNLYFEKARQIHISTQRDICLAFSELRHEGSAERRREIMNSIVWMKKNDVFRNADKKELVGLSGHKRKGLARGLKKIRQNCKHMTREEYIKARENVLSYY